MFKIEIFTIISKHDIRHKNCFSMILTLWYYYIPYGITIELHHYELNASYLNCHNRLIHLGQIHTRHYRPNFNVKSFRFWDFEHNRNLKWF